MSLYWPRLDITLFINSPYIFPVPDPDLEIKGRRWRGGGIQKNFFRPELGPQFGLKIKGGGLPWIRHCFRRKHISFVKIPLQKWKLTFISGCKKMQVRPLEVSNRNIDWAWKITILNPPITLVFYFRFYSTSFSQIYTKIRLQPRPQDFSLF